MYSIKIFQSFPKYFLPFRGHYVCKVTTAVTETLKILRTEEEVEHDY